MSKIYKSINEFLGNTPLLELTNTEQKHQLEATVLTKIECYNPSGSIKHRVAYEMICDAEEKGLIHAGATLIEPTSGNTGIGLCSVAVTKGYKAIIVMPENMSEERKKIMRGFGAELVLTPSSLGMSGAIAKAEELHKNTPNSFIPSQFDNPANARAHIKTTGPEIWRDTDGKVDIFVAGVGTGGTITGIGTYLKTKNPNIQIVAVEPLTSPVLSKGTPGKHSIQGIGANFVPKVLDTSIYGEIISVSNEDAIQTAKSVGKTEGILCGISSGANLYAAIQLAKRPENKGKTIVTVFPDSGERYLSTALFED